jgi:hypothetical protein
VTGFWPDDEDSHSELDFGLILRRGFQDSPLELGLELVVVIGLLNWVLSLGFSVLVVQERGSEIVSG